MWRGTPVAVKRWFDPKMSDELVQQFRAECLTLRELRHPHVIQARLLLRPTFSFYLLFWKMLP